ncbi:MAG: magnesium chelatase [Candidatus Tagabacteria bacterium CG10_big_fil_rev_8_21_14_0_10_40_13]|uniref:Magnesium chelatase n=1 Tax=Candidatus Tagabacteria bacterium CG10_big_fil_rev_8_21_14_0_10_40_13 TaxID=1975022 RepID=A0A2M8L8B1_9BACT|nr:MAG: magnesium chelatase [Candidatus Tagabacteria bacterium CG10_big_fil_rev_8_21_14_0_10_40_13]
MAIKVHSGQVLGLNGEIIDVEIDLSQGLHHFSIVGLPDKAVEESKDRISAAIKNSGLESPRKGNKRITVSLAPANIKKEGPVFDLAIALSFLLASGQTNFSTENKIFLGELGLDGEIHPIKGALNLAKIAKENNFKEIYLPKQNAEEAALMRGISIYGTNSLGELLRHLQKEELIKQQPETAVRFENNLKHLLDFSDIKGQETAKRGLEIAAAGGHNVSMTGPPGTGKTMLAKAFTSILPPLSLEESLETTSIHSVAGVLEGAYMTSRPLRSPHHTSSYVALVGGGAWPKPGEITLAHRGVLFLDEFPLFERRVLESLRQPIEDGVVTISRARSTIRFPARFILLCAMNPCPCGNLGSATKECKCSQADLLRYQRKVSGPIIDRIDLWLNVPQVEIKKLSDDKITSESSAEIQKRIIKARKIQEERFRDRPILTNAEMGVKELREFAPLPADVRNILDQAAQKMDLSARAYHRVIKLARTIADLEENENISENHIFEALQYRPKQN